MFCFGCGASMPDGSPVCTQCGAEARNAPQPPVMPQSQVPGWSQPGMAQPYRLEPPTDGKAMASMIFGIVGMLCFWGVLGIPAVILGHLGRASISKSMGRLKGEGMATAGLVMGYLNIVLGILLVIAIVLPAVKGTRGVVNEQAAASTVRTLNAAQSRYSAEVGSNGTYAPDLATLGPGPSGKCEGVGTAEHACLIDSILGNEQCKSGLWCMKQRYRYSMTGICAEDRSCSDYVIVASPATPFAGKTSYCSTSDLTVRFRSGPIFTPLRTVEECRSWTALPST
jgi:Domain of unknown function (DUF4190)